MIIIFYLALSAALQLANSCTAMSENQYIPVIDFKACGLDKEVCSNEELTRLGKLLVPAFSTVGFAYLKFTGISNECVDKVNEVTAKFFKSSFNEKERYNKKSGQNFGYVGIGKERFDPSNPCDYKEAYDIEGAAFFRSNEDWPNDLAPGFSDVILDFMEQSKKLSLRILHAMAIGLELEDEDFFAKCHSKMHTDESFTAGRTLYYPPVTSDLEPGQQRLLEHSDYTSITLVFQDSIGGLQVKQVNGEYVDATPIKGTVLVNIGNTMQHWTKGKLKSTKHRVIIPESEFLLKSVRRSLAYFVHPNNDVHINKPLVFKDNSLNDNDKIPHEKLVTSKEYISGRARALWEDENY